jgi:hypothetical protein
METLVAAEALTDGGLPPAALLIDRRLVAQTVDTDDGRRPVRFTAPIDTPLHQRSSITFSGIRDGIYAG